MCSAQGRIKYFFPLLLQHNAGHAFFILEVARWHTMTYHCQKHSSGQVISLLQRPPPDNTRHSQQTSMPSDGFDLQSQQASGRRPVPYTAQPLGPAALNMASWNFSRTAILTVIKSVVYLFQNFALQWCVT